METDSRRHGGETAQGEWVERTPDAQVLVLALPLTPCEIWGRSLPSLGCSLPICEMRALGPHSWGELGEEGVLTGATRELCCRG